MVRPRNRVRVNTHANTSANGRLRSTLRVATLKLNVSASLSLALSHIIASSRYGASGVTQYTVRSLSLRIRSMPNFQAVAPATASHDTSAASRIGVLLVNLGTPDAPTYFAVQRYLREFLSDPRVIDTSRLIWLPILYGAVLPFRPLRTARNYRKIWMKEGSPLAVYSKRLAAKVSSLLSAAFQDGVRLELAMTYGSPSIAHAVQSFAEQGIDKLLVLPLYPQYCCATTGSVIDGTHRALKRWRSLPESRFIDDYYNDGGYIDALSRKIRQHWEAMGERSHLLFSYHGIPASYVA